MVTMRSARFCRRSNWSERYRSRAVWKTGHAYSRRSLVGTFAHLIGKETRDFYVHIPLQIIRYHNTCPSNLADETTSVFIVTGSKVLSDFVNDILSSLHFDSFNWKPPAREFAFLLCHGVHLLRWGATTPTV